MILGGPFLPHIDRILRDRASSMSSPIISASDAGVRTSIKGIGTFKGRPSQCCDLVIENTHGSQLVCSFEPYTANNLSAFDLIPFVF